jgi:hypothetical protein
MGLRLCKCVYSLLTAGRQRSTDLRQKAIPERRIRETAAAKASQYKWKSRDCLLSANEFFPSSAFERHFLRAAVCEAKCRRVYHCVQVCALAQTARAGDGLTFCSCCHTLQTWPFLRRLQILDVKYRAPAQITFSHQRASNFGIASAARVLGISSRPAFLYLLFLDFHEKNEPLVIKLFLGIFLQKTGWFKTRHR